MTRLRRLSPSQRLDFERACNTIAVAILLAAFIIFAERPL